MKKQIIALLIFAGLLNTLPLESARGHRGHHSRHGHRGHHHHRQHHPARHHHGHNRRYHHHRHVVHHGWYGGYGYNAWWGYPSVWRPGIGIYIYTQPGVYRGTYTTFANDTESRFRVSSDTNVVVLRPGEQKRVTRRSCRFTIKNIDTGKVDRITKCTRSIYLTDEEHESEDNEY